MRSKSDFWLTLHQLARDLEREGSTPTERAQSVCDVLGALTPETRGVYMSNLQVVLASLAEARTHCQDESRE